MADTEETPAAPDTDRTEEEPGRSQEEVKEAAPPGSAARAGSSTQGMSERDQQWIQQYAFTTEQLDEVKECFEMFDRQGIDRIGGGDLGNALRALGQNPTEANLRTYLDEAAMDDDNNISLDEYVRIVGEKGIKTETEQEEELEEALRVFDKEGMGTLDATELRKIMKTYGEVLDDDDISEMLKVAEVAADGKIDYGEFMRKIIAK